MCGEGPLGTGKSGCGRGISGACVARVAVCVARVTDPVTNGMYKVGLIWYGGDMSECMAGVNACDTLGGCDYQGDWLRRDGCGHGVCGR